MNLKFFDKIHSVKSKANQSHVQCQQFAESLSTSSDWQVFATYEHL